VGRPALGNRDRENTPQDITFLPKETVTVTDPRHPLFGRTLPMLGITNKQNLVPCCVVWIAAGIERMVPVAATDRAAEPPYIFPAPLNVVAVQQLLAAFERITSRSVEEAENESRRRRKQDELSGLEQGRSTTWRSGDDTDADLGGSHTGAATNGDTDTHSDQPLSDSDLRGGEP
jgi:hypothetical protein